MNSLNSVLLEGNVISGPSVIPNNRCSFYVISRYENEKGEPKTINTHVIAEGRLAQSCLENLRVDRGVRLVGRLSMSEINLGAWTTIEHTYVFAEHVEFKPVGKAEAL